MEDLLLKVYLISVLNSGIPAEIESRQEIIKTLLEGAETVCRNPGSSRVDLRAKCGRIVVSSSGIYFAVCDGYMELFSKYLKGMPLEVCVREDKGCEITAKEEVASSKDIIEDKEIKIKKRKRK